MQMAGIINIIIIIIIIIICMGILFSRRETRRLESLESLRK